MSENRKIVGVSSSSGTKRRPQQELHSFGEPAAKTSCRRSNSENGHGFEIGATENPNSNNSSSSDGVWSEEQHRDFVSSIFEIGLKNASPAIIQEYMIHKMETITSERVKSKLQKYRSNKNKENSKQEFIRQYSEFLQKIKSIQATIPQGIQYQLGVDGVPLDPVLLRLIQDLTSSHSSKKNALLSGDVAGYLTYRVMKENTRKDTQLSPDGTVPSSSSVLPTNVLRKGAREYVDNYAGFPMQFPVLTEIEKKSSLGIGMTFIAGLFLTMSQHLTRERARAETIGLKKSPITSTLGAATSNEEKERGNI